MSDPTLHEHYYALDLRPGASPEEVRSAYRRLARLYHPDKDASLDAEVRYREIRLAYEVLRKRVGSGETTPKTSSPPPRPSESQARKARAGGTGGTSHDGRRRWETEYGADWDESLYGGKKPLKKRVPFSIAALPQIFMASLRELIANPGVVAQVMIATVLIRYSYKFSGSTRWVPHKGLVWGIAAVSGTAAVVLRYYVTLRNKGRFAVFVVMFYGVGAEFLVSRAYSFDDTGGGIGLAFTLAAGLLAANPLGWLWDAIKDSRDFARRNASKSNKA